MKSFLNNLIQYLKTGETGSCPFCGCENVRIEELNIGRHSLTFTCTECGKSEHYDGCYKKGII